MEPDSLDNRIKSMYVNYERVEKRVEKWLEEGDGEGEQGGRERGGEKGWRKGEKWNGGKMKNRGRAIMQGVYVSASDMESMPHILPNHLFILEYY